MLTDEVSKNIVNELPEQKHQKTLKQYIYVQAMKLMPRTAAAATVVIRGGRGLNRVQGAS